MATETDSESLLCGEVAHGRYVLADPSFRWRNRAATDKVQDGRIASNPASFHHASVRPVAPRAVGCRATGREAHHLRRQTRPHHDQPHGGVLRAEGPHASAGLE